MLVHKRSLRLYLKCSQLGSLKIIRCPSHSLGLKQPRDRQEQFTMLFKQKEKTLKVGSFFPYPTFKSLKLSCQMERSAGHFQQQAV